MKFLKRLFMWFFGIKPKRKWFQVAAVFEAVYLDACHARPSKGVVESHIEGLKYWLSRQSPFHVKWRKIHKWDDKLHLIISSRLIDDYLDLLDKEFQDIPVPPAHLPQQLFVEAGSQMRSEALREILEIYEREGFEFPEVSEEIDEEEL